MISSNSLTIIFHTSQKNFKFIDESSLPSNSAEYQQKVNDNIESFKLALQIVQSESYFSKNEELEDVRTDVLQFLLIPYYLGELELKVVDKDRIFHLRQSQGHFTTFLNQAEHFRLIHTDDLEAFHREDPPSAEQKRQEAISRHTRKKKVAQQLQKVISKRDKLLKDLGEEGLEELDEEDHREEALALIQICILEAISQNSIVAQELSMLSQIQAMRNQGVDPLDPTHRPPPQSNNIGNFTILKDGTRREITKGVFQTKNLPSMTVEEWGAHQASLAASHSHGPSSQGRKAANEDEEDEDFDSDAKDLKAREWADWVDENPRGAGNTKGNIG